MVESEPQRLSREDYLVFERGAASRHELWSGEVLAMAGGSREHNLLVGNVVTELNLALRARACEVYPSDMKVRVEAATYFYADASVVCGEPRFDDESRDAISNPKLVVEVLSDSTERYDRGDKFASYRKLTSLTDYLLVSSNQVRVEHFAREEDGSWRLRVLGASDRIVVASLSIELDVDGLYRKVFGTAGVADL